MDVTSYFLISLALFQTSGLQKKTQLYVIELKCCFQVHLVQTKLKTHKMSSDLKY